MAWRIVRVTLRRTACAVRTADASSDPLIAASFIERFWQPRREVSTAFIVRSIDRGVVRADIDIEAALDAVYAPLWIRLLIGFGPLNYQLVDGVLDVVWSGLATQPGPRSPTRMGAKQETAQ